MKKFYMLSVLCTLYAVLCHAQVKSNYLYNTAMPYGTLDIRTKITSTNYFYIQEGKTFAFRESSPGVKTNAYLDMTSFDSSPYQQGNLRRKNGSIDQFVMNYRLLLPLNYNASYSEGYPLMLLLHGAVERGNCYYNNCYHANWSYDPNTNNPPAPKTATHKLLNNDHNLINGGKNHLDARNKAAGKLPNDPTVTGKAFPGFVLVPQMFNVWDSLNVQDAIRLVQLIAQKYNIDENRIYVHGLSIGGYAVYEALKRASWLFAAAQPMSAVNDASIRKYNQTGKVVHIPIWAFQGGTDTAPSPTFTRKLISDFNNAGAVMRYTEYAGVGHTCWYKAFAEADFYPWMLRQSKVNIHVSKGITAIKGTQYPKLILAEGFFAYQWEKDGVIISGASSNTYIAKTPGKYRARFSRVAAPTATQWNKWSPVVTITTATTARVNASETDSVVMQTETDELLSLNVFPNPGASRSLNVTFTSPDKRDVRIQMFDALGTSVYDMVVTYDKISAGMRMDFKRELPEGMYIVLAQQEKLSKKAKVLIRN
jgi:hypothetical protein